MNWDVAEAIWQDGYITGWQEANSPARIRKRARDRKYYASPKGKANRQRKRSRA